MVSNETMSLRIAHERILGLYMKYSMGWVQIPPLLEHHFQS